MEDIKRKGLEDVVFDAIVLPDVSTQHPSQDPGITTSAVLVDLAVFEIGISRVLGKYGILRFDPLSSDDPIVLQQPVEDLDSKKALCYQHLHFKYRQEYEKRQQLAEILGYQMQQILTDWYEACLQDIGKRFERLGYR
ncbi:unnamed protein product [Penicillium roqueforti FM164]|uniref:Genomic scaffold, ProqFM164S03 n=1 Tax=Penicillium roqueforti (strain FM164) TaxID=1365484 RepID=W6QDA4_PENRF|nr:unnamed protein product [Penicillium roqueforti FM164]